MGRPAATLGDFHICPMFDGPKPHVGGPTIAGSPNVLIGGAPAVRQGDTAICVGPPDAVAEGSPTVFINGLPAATQGCATVHGGLLVVGNPTVLIG